ncbi:Ras and EF-hand domain-containing protein [Actinidia chinensis var. chinensis]|uniref:Ras and EF-hand domain-containing protein n=1 Tax=Actinidia chinensis var. chinensis TaxID=1590841 RepID=A0A2R6RK57_ACTCC|nr:Ras and EF-hand domain-containing protein [Actinidia chinensis var. chinensis]
MATADLGEGDEWELVDDDGFVYKRKKRPRLDLDAAGAPPPPDPADEDKSWRERKRRALTKLREKYQSEIGQWELLSNTLKALQEKALTRQQQQQRNEHTTNTASSSDITAELPRPSENSSDSADRRLLDDLLLRAEAEEAIIQDASNLCDMAEAICSQQEELMKQSLFDLPVWRSPRELMSFLCDE